MRLLEKYYNQQEASLLIIYHLWNYLKYKLKNFMSEQFLTKCKNKQD